MNLLTAEQSCHQIPGYKFNFGSCWSELPGGSLLITGGNIDNTTLREVVRIDTLRECAVSTQPPMHTAKYGHATVYHFQYLYVLGRSHNSFLSSLSECERYVCAESRWEVLPALPVACCDMSAVVLDNSLYAFGGLHSERSDTVQKLSLDSLTWELMQTELPQPARCFPCFKSDAQVYMVMNATLYSFTPLQVKPIKTFPGRIECTSYYPALGCYYSRGTLFFENDEGITTLAVGELA
jgi:hypothetical protein